VFTHIDIFVSSISRNPRLCGYSHWCSSVRCWKKIN